VRVGRPSTSSSRPAKGGAGQGPEQSPPPSFKLLNWWLLFSFFPLTVLRGGKVLFVFDPRVVHRFSFFSGDWRSPSERGGFWTAGFLESPHVPFRGGSPGGRLKCPVPPGPRLSSVSWSIQPRHFAAIEMVDTLFIEVLGFFPWSRSFALCSSSFPPLRRPFPFPGSSPPTPG